jgi:hypothetical protein
MDASIGRSRPQVSFAKLNTRKAAYFVLGERSLLSIVPVMSNQQTAMSSATPSNLRQGKEAVVVADSPIYIYFF